MQQDKDTNQQAKDYENLEKRVQLLEAESSQYDKTPDILYSQVGRKDLLDIESERILETMWNDFLYITPFYAESARVLDGSSGTGSGTFSTEGIVCETGATSGGVGERSLASVSEIIKRTRETRFRAIAKVDATTAVTAFVGCLGLDGLNSTGFVFDSGTLKGRVNNGSTTTDVSLQSYAANTYYELELVLYPGSGVKFLVDGIEKGSISGGNLLPQGTSNIYIFTASISNSAAANKILYVSYLEFIQRRK